MIRGFRTYDLALVFYRECRQVRLPHHLKDQLLRAASSICLNLGEGSAKASAKDRLRFYSIALASCREVQSVIALEPEALGTAVVTADKLGAHLYKLCRP
ncbi:MAG: four helix bundle protein [Bdellovibrionales bacterium]|nr:four helix bundle protein [Bdellovibrionales bacterium]